jgi:L-rhamnose-H+ transport protein
MQDVTMGGLLLVLAGIMNGSFALPMKAMPRWQWENIWLIWSILALLFLPLGLAILCVPHLWSGAGEVSSSGLFLVVLYGAAWGIAQVLFGLSVSAIGMALTFSLVLGISAALGAAVPFFRQHADLLWTRAGALLFSGLLVLAMGMVLCAWAGILRERVSERAAGAVAIQWGLLLAIVSGVLASAMNIGFSYATELSHMARHHGASAAGSAAAEWLPLLAGGAIPNLLYALYLLRRNRSVSLYASAPLAKYLLLTVCMAGLWFGGTILYGIASSMLGSMGTVLGWPTFMSIVVVVASLIGWMAGEWKGSGARPLRVQLAGLAMLVAAVFLFSKVVT